MKTYEVKMNDVDWETPCMDSADHQHCECWYDGEVCHFCHAAAQPPSEDPDSIDLSEIALGVE